MRRLLVLVSAIVLLDVAFYSAIPPLLPHYSDELGLGKGAAGVLTASYAAGTLLGSLPAAWLAARIGPRQTVLIGLVLFGAASLTFGLAQDIVVLDGARFLQGIGGAASWAGGLTWLLAATPDERRGEFIGVALGAAVAGALLGPVIGTAAVALSPEAVFGSLCVVSAVLAIAALRSAPPPASLPTPLREVGRAFLARPVLAAAWLMTLPSLFSGLFNTLVPLRLDELGTSALAIGGLFLAAAAIEAVLAPFVGRFSDRRGRLPPLRIGLLVTAVVAVVLPWPESAAVVGALLVVAGVAAGASFAPAIALLSDAADDVGLAQAYAFGLVNLMWAGGQTLGAGAGSRVAEATSDAVPCVAATVLVLVTLAVGARRRTGHGIVA